MTLEVLKSEFCHLFFTASPFVAVVVARIVYRNPRIVVPKQTVSSLGIIIMQSAVDSVRVVGTFDGEKPQPGPVPSGKVCSVSTTTFPSPANGPECCVLNYHIMRGVAFPHSFSQRCMKICNPSVWVSDRLNGTNCGLCNLLTVFILGVIPRESPIFVITLLRFPSDRSDFR